MKNVAIVVAILAVIGGAAFALTRNSDSKADQTANDTTTSTPASATPDSNTTTATQDEQSGGKEITYTDNGFSPNKITVKAGTKVTIKNDSGMALQFDSDPHPAHTDNTELNVDTVQQGGSQTFTVVRKGTFGYHNHLNPSDEGTIVVE